MGVEASGDLEVGCECVDALGEGGAEEVVVVEGVAVGEAHRGVHVREDGLGARAVGDAAEDGEGVAVLGVGGAGRGAAAAVVEGAGAGVEEEGVDGGGDVLGARSPAAGVGGVAEVGGDGGGVVEG